MSQFRQDNRFTGKMSGDINDLNQPSQTYKKAVNLFSRDYGNLTSLVREKSDLFVDWTTYPGDEPAAYNWVAAFRVPTFDPNGVEKEWIIAFMDLPSGGAIYQIDPDLPTRIHKLHDDTNAGAAYDRNDLLVFDKDMDASIYREGDQTYVFWVCKGSRPRCIVLVSDQSSLTQHDVSATVGAFMGAANVADSLYIQDLVPGDGLAADRSTTGNMFCGTYQYAYRYVNRNSGKTSRISLLSNVLSVIPDINVRINNVTGGGPGQRSNTGIRVVITSQAGYHRAYYDSVQFFQIKWLGNSEAIVEATDPEEIDAAWYATTPGVASLERIFTGDENFTTYTMDQLLEVNANIEEALVLEERDGRLYLGNVTYSDLKSGMNWQNDISDVTHVNTRILQFNYTSPDPLTAVAPAGQEDPNTASARGYRGGEVYRFGITYWNKFGEFSIPDRIKFTSTTRRTQANHAAGGWGYNWAISGVTDWKFPERDTPETGLLTGVNGPGLFYMEFNVQQMPDWAYGSLVVRRKRIKNIIAQTPIINAMSIHGAYSAVDPETADDVTIFERPWLAQGNFDTSGVNDTYEPKVLSYGMTKSINIQWHQGTVNAKKRLFFPIFRKNKEKDFDGTELNTSASRNSLLYLYPLEYLANDNGEPFYTENLDGAYLEIFDCMMCTGYNAARTNAVRDTLTGANVLQGAAANYVWLFAPVGKDQYWSTHNSLYLKMYERGTNAYDAGIPVGPQRVRIGSSWTIGYASLPTVIGEGYSDEEATINISKANGLADLWASQADNTNGIFKNSDYRYPGAITNQRAILVSMDSSDDSAEVIPVIQDPTDYIYRHFQTGAGDYADIVGAGGVPTISARAVSEPVVPADVSNISAIEDPFMIEPGSGVPVLMANITKNLLDDRYGEEESEEWISTGGALYVNQATLTILNGNPAAILPIDVYGGDTYVTRAVVKIRDNAPVINTVEVSDEEDVDSHRKYLQYQGAYSDTGATNGDQVGRVTGYESYVEYLMFYVEAEVNGAWFSRPSDSFPSGFTGRIANADDETGFPDFVHDETIINRALAPITYLYNFAYSKGIGTRNFFSGFDLQRDILNPFSRIHYTPQRVYEEWEFPFHRWLTGDYHDLPRSGGPITRLVKTEDDRMIAIQIDDVFMLYLGISVAEDQDGTAFTLQSSRVVGSDASMTGASSKFVTAGAYTPGESILTPFGLFFYDRRRNQVFRVRGGVQPISDNFVQDLLTEDFIAGADVDSGSQYRPRMFYEHSKRRLWLTNWNATVGELRGICYNCAEERWETMIHVTAAQGAKEINAMISTSKGEVAFTDDGTTGEIYERREGTDFGGMFGSTVESTVTFELNNTQHSAFPKVLKTVQVQGDTAPASVQAVVKRLGVSEQDSGQVLLGKERRGTFLFSNFRDNGGAGTRIRGEQIEITVTYSGAAKTSLESVQTTYRLDHRSKLR